MKAPALLLELLRNGAQVWVEGDELRLRAPKGTITPTLREELSQRKPEVIALLEQQAKHALPRHEALRTTLAGIIPRCT